MAEEEKSESSEGSEKAGEGSEGGKKKGLIQDFEGMKGWQKAGVLIGAGALVIAILMYINSQNSSGGQAVPNGLLASGAGAQPTNYSGAGDIYPSVPTSSGNGASSQPPVTHGSVPPTVHGIPPGDSNGTNTKKPTTKPPTKKKSSVTPVAPGVSDYRMSFKPGGAIPLQGLKMPSLGRKL